MNTQPTACRTPALTAVAERSAFFEVRIPLRRKDGLPDNGLLFTCRAVERAGCRIERACVTTNVHRFVSACVEYSGAETADAVCAAVEAALCVTDIRDLSTL